jgi:hypothetical protein
VRFYTNLKLFDYIYTDLKGQSASGDFIKPENSSPEVERDWLIWFMTAC